MTSTLSAALVCTSCICIGVASASDLELTIRAHSESIVFGDPLYLETSIVNRGKDTVQAYGPSDITGSFEIRARDSANRRLEINCFPKRGSPGLAEDPSPIPYLPGVARKARWEGFLPYANELKQPFWNEIHNREWVQIWGIVWIERNLALKSNVLTIRVIPRKADEIAVLKRWSPLNQATPDTNIWPSDVGVDLYGVHRRDTTAEVASQVKSGELAGLLQLTLRLQKLYHEADTREAESAALVDWIRKQPDIKRQILAKHISGTYQAIVTADAISALTEIAGAGP